MAWGSGPTVYLVHGWAGHAGQLAPFVAPARRAAGFRVVAFDAPSHGALGPRRVRAALSSTALEFAARPDRGRRRRRDRRTRSIAHSLGATATAVALCDGLRGRAGGLPGADGECSGVRA